MNKKRRCKGACDALQFERKSLSDGLEDVVYFILCDTNVSLGNLDAGVVEDFVQQYKSFCATVVGLVNVTSECLTESMGREIPDFDFVVVLEILQLLVDILDSERLASSLAFEHELVPVWTAKQFVQVMYFLLDGLVERNRSRLFRFLFRHSARVHIQHIFPVEV